MSQRPFNVHMQTVAKIVLGGLLLGSSCGTYAQAPSVSLVDRAVGAAGRKVTLTGTNFGNVAADATVFFGAAKGEVITVTPQLVEVKVPYGATFDNIAFYNTNTGLMATSPQPFLPSFGGEHPFSATKLASQINFQAGRLLYDHCLCDLDGDGKTDIASANDNTLANDNTSVLDDKLSLFRNIGSPGTINFETSSINTGFRLFHIRCGDLNGDGKPELITTEGGEGSRIFILRNNSTPGVFSFTNQSITVTGRKPKQIDIADIDQDGKPELIVTDQKSGNVIVLPNTSTLSAIGFNTPQIVPVTGALSTDGLAVKDLDGDRLPEVIVSQFLSANSNIFILKNESTPGSLHLEKQTTLPITGTLVNLKVGDLDMDGKPDLATTQLLTASVSILLNQSTETEIKFASATPFLVDEQPWGLDFGDIDGDGKVDVAVASITKKSVTILNNESTPGALQFQRFTIPTSFINRHIRLGDLDGDAKPDVSFTSIDDNNLGVPASQISVMRNVACMVPSLLPEGPLKICTGFPLRLFSSESGGATYEWKQDGTTVTTGTDPFFDPTADGSYTVTVIAEGTTCSKTSLPVVVDVVAESSASVPVISSNTPVCLGDALTLSATSTGATDFVWRGPEGFSAAGASVSRADFQLKFAGRYEVDVMVNTCVARQSSVIIDAIALPAFRVSYAGSEVVCAGDTKTLSVSPASANFTYQWFEQTAGLLAGETASTLSINTSGEYYYEAKSVLYSTCPAAESVPAKLVVAALPVVTFQAPTSACEDKPVPFTNQSVTDPQTTAFFAWDFGDGFSSTDANPLHTFATSQTFNVKLTVSYGSNTCPVSITKAIQVIPPPSATITTTDPDFAICEDETITLAVNGTFETYLWSNNATTSTIQVTETGDYTVQLVTAVGCELSATRTVTALLPPTVQATATPPLISIGQVAQLAATGLTDYLWQPGKTLSDSTISNPEATPRQTTLYTVTGKGPNGCVGKDTVTVRVKQENISSLIAPANFFSPNGDASNNQWVIGNILSFPQCTVAIYDEKGVKVYEAKPYLNDWDGTHNGKPLPNGVYYYFVRCEGDQGKPKSGSITLLR